jgi:hypothetical protein
MATLGSNVLTLADWAKRLDPDGKVPDIVEMLSETNEILDDMLFMEGNLPTGHRTNVRTGLPTVAWKLINQGVTPSKSTTAQIDEACAIMEAWSEVDKDLAELNGNTAAFRLSEAQAFIEAMNQEQASTLFYGDQTTAPEEFTGLAPRFSALSSSANSDNVLSGGGSGSDNASIYLVCWGSNSVHGIFPKGSKAGLDHVNHGEVTIQDSTGVGTSRLRVYQDQFRWKCGIALKDWRYVVRIANIDISDLIANSGSQANLINLMIKAIHRIPSLNMGKCAFYMNRTCFQMLDIQRRDDVAAAGMQYKEVDGKLVPSFRGIPIRKVDALLETEATVS